MDDYEEHSFRLGQVVRKGQTLESAVTIVLARSLRVNDAVATILAGHLGLGGTLRAIKSLSALQIQEFPLDVAAVGEWLKLANEAAEARNRAVHQPWAAIAENDGQTRGLNARLNRRDAKFTLAPPEELDAIIALIERAATEGASLAGVLVDISKSNPSTE